MRNNNPNEIPIKSLEEIKTIILGILVFFDDLCKKNNLKYSLAYGTMLGAIRHRGFIPWDDDIDVYMLRSDYDKFVNVMQNETQFRYKLFSLETDDAYDSVIPKLVDTNTHLLQERAGSQTDKNGMEKYQLGLYIDIFVLDSLPTSVLKQKLVIKQAVILQKIWGFCFFTAHKKNNKIVRYFRNKMNKTQVAHFMARQINSFAKRQNLNYSQLRTNIINQGKSGCINDICRSEDFDKCRLIQFEGHDFYILPDYDSILRKWHGDYMIPPPEKERVRQHSYKAYWRNEEA